MKQSKLLGMLVALVLSVAACSSSDSDASADDDSGAEAAETTTTQSADAEPVEGEDASEPGATTPTTVAEPGDTAVPQADGAQRIVSLSPTATESLFAINAGGQVIAVDDQSNFPAEAPVTDLSAFTPNVEAIAGFEPDLVVISYDPGGIVEGLEALGIDVLVQAPALDLADAYAQIEQLGAASGHIGDAAEVVSEMQTKISELTERAANEGTEGTFFHEVDNTLYSATSSTFAGQIYAMTGLTNIADAVDPDGEFYGYPQLSSEYVVEQNPTFIFLADAAYGESLETVEARPGWGGLDAVVNSHVIDLDADLASRWGPRIPTFLENILNITLAVAAE